MTKKSFLWSVAIIGLSYSCQKSADILPDTKDANASTNERKAVTPMEMPHEVSVVDKYILVGNKTTSCAEVYHLTDMGRKITSADMVWQSPVISGISEVKRVNYLGTDAVLCTTNNGAIVYSYPDNRLLFHREITGWSMNIHSAEVLPDGNVVAADSYGWLGILFPSGDPGIAANVNQASASTKWYALTFAHGAVWDKANNRLYALGYTDLKAFQYNTTAGTPSASSFTMLADYNFSKYYERCSVYNMCSEDGSWEDGGHDLFPVENSTSKIFLTTGERAFIFDISKNPLPAAGQTVVAVLDAFDPMFKIDSKMSRQEAPTAQADKIVLQKGGIKSISGDPSENGFVIAHTTPWFNNTYSYYYNLPYLVYTRKSTDRVDVDISPNNKINFFSDLNMQFYKARLFY